MDNKLSPEALDRLYNCKELSQAEIAEKFDISQPAVSRMMKRYGIESRSSKRWSEHEEEILKNNYLDSGKEKMLDLLPGRTWNAIKLKAMDMGLTRSLEEYRHSEEVKNLLESNSKRKKIEVDFEVSSELSYVLGVVEGDGFTDNKGTIGLEVKSRSFADKFINSLDSVNLNPNKGSKGDKIAVWASSVELDKWLRSMENSDTKIEWLFSKGDPWQYIEGLYDSDGNLHPSGSPRICSYNKTHKETISRVLMHLDIECNIQQNNVWVSKSDSGEFFSNVTSAISSRNPD
ncbi:MAG: hypothetical protein ABEJ03_04640 [Candidatus Nanohaloarchaea archaeon]